MIVKLIECTNILLNVNFQIKKLKISLSNNYFKAYLYAHDNNLNRKGCKGF